MSKLQHITISIADVPRIDMSIEPSREALIRKIEDDVNKMWRAFTKKYPSKTSHEIMAMCAVRYAQVYYEHINELEKNESALAEALSAMDKILLDVK